MKYILCQNTSYTRKPLYFIEVLSEWKSSALSKASHNKPILISTNEQILKLVIHNFKERNKK